MTERLTDLMNREADRLDIPAPPAAAVLGRGRALRRRRRTTQAVAGVAAIAVIGAGAVFLQQSGDTRAVVDPAGREATASPLDLGAVFAIGDTVYLEDGTVSATIDDRSVKSLYYTSAGVLVRHGNNPYSDGGGPQRFSLVAPDGTVTPLGLETEETVHATDPTQPYVAYAQEVDGEVSVHVRDVTTDEEVADVVVPGAAGGFYPVSLSGDTVYVGAGDDVFAVDWRTGASAPAGVTSSAVAGGHAVDYGSGATRVVDADTGDVLLRVEVDPDSYGYFSLSPDGRHAKLTTEDPMGSDDPRLAVYDVERGTSVSVSGYSYDYGWTSGGDLFRLSDRGELALCGADTGECTETTPDLDVLPDRDSGDLAGYLVLGGVEYES